ncbi:MAG: hypothetical protein HQL39_13165 [Alphaproteobacteria bacterium]|nr:hypothetical protein [Alphaproteobacteria bacterium]
MSRLPLFALALFVLFPADSARAAWQYKTSTDPFTDIRSHAATLVVKDGKNSHALVVRCNAGTLESVVDLGKALGKKPVAVRWRIDKGDPVQEQWAPSADGKSVLAPDAAVFARLMARGQTLAFEATSNRNVTYLVRGSLAGSGEAIRRVFTACGLPATE